MRSHLAPGELMQGLCQQQLLSGRISELIVSYQPCLTCLMTAVRMIVIMSSTTLHQVGVPPPQPLFIPPPPPIASARFPLLCFCVAIDVPCCLNRRAGAPQHDIVGGVLVISLQAHIPRCLEAPRGKHLTYRCRCIFQPQRMYG